jgi:hypothetical protein
MGVLVIYEPIPISPLRGLGFGVEGDGWWCWKHVGGAPRECHQLLEYPPSSDQAWDLTQFSGECKRKIESEPMNPF